MRLLTINLMLLTAPILVGAGVATAQTARANTVTIEPLTDRIEVGEAELQPVQHRHRARRGHRYRSRGHYNRPHRAGRYYRYPYYSRYGYYPRHYRRYGRTVNSRDNGKDAGQTNRI